MLAPLAFELTVPWIMRGPALVGQAPRDLRWSADGATLRFRWAKPDGKGEPEMKEYAVGRDGTGLAPAAPETLAERIARTGVRDGSRTLYTDAGGVFLRDDTRTEARRLVERGNAPTFLDGGEAVLFFRNGDPYRVDLADGRTVQLAHLVPGKSAPAVAATSDSQKALAEDQPRLLKGFSPSGVRGPGREARGRPDRTAEGEKGGVAIAIPDGYRAGAVTVSPSGRFATVEVAQEFPAPRTAEVPSFVTRSGYTENLPTYPKVGDPRTSERLLWVDLTTGATTTYTPPRAGGVGPVRWAKTGDRAAFWTSAEDHKDAWLVAMDAKASKTVWTEHDDAWIGGPLRGFLTWTPAGRIAFGTETNGFANLWSANPDGSDSVPIVQGEYEVSDVTFDAPRGRFLFVSSAGSPFKRHVDAVPAEGGTVERLIDLSADEDAAYAISPSGDLAVVRSSPARPAELWVAGRQITDTPTAEWKAYPWIEAPIVRIPAQDGSAIPAKLYKPKNWRRGGPAVLFVHGAGYLQNVYEGWSHYYRETMFNQLLMRKGYAVLDMDFRASAGYGKAWRTAIYRDMGGKDLSDNVDGARWLVKNLGANPKRIGLYGGSYGGFLTLMAMFKASDTFAAGAALRPVADWAHYNDGYTSAILNRPQDDPGAYRRSSPIGFAEGLKGALLVCHGMVDTNVHFQDSVRLSERLIELGKENWEIAPYPVEDHAFTRPESWTDEYRRILALFERTIGTGWRR